MGEGRRGSMVRNAVRNIVFACADCCCFSVSTKQLQLDPFTDTNVSEITESTTSMPTCKNLCAICLDPLNYSTNKDPSEAIFTAQCSHAFHFLCISSNVRHGSLTCPICRARWTQPPRNISLTLQNDPVLRILDDSIATFRVHRQSFLRSARYDDDDPITPRRQDPTHRLHFSLPHHKAYLSVKMEYQQAIDLVLVASPYEPHLRLLKQLMSLTVFSLRSIDRLAIVAYSPAAARVFPLRRMTSYGKRAALQIIDRLFCCGQADPFEGIKKGWKILEDRVHKNQRSCILHISGSSTRHYRAMDMEMHIPIHRFNAGFGNGTSSGLVMHEFEEFLARMLGNVIKDTQLWIRDQEGRMMVRLGEMRNGEERRIAMNMNIQGEDRHNVCIGYSYVDGGLDECNIITGEALVRVLEKTVTSSTDNDHDDLEVTRRIRGRTSNCENWDYHDPYMARRWAKHLHGYRL